MTLVLPPVPKSDWREPSQRWCGLSDIENRTWFRIQAKDGDGRLFWRGWFEDRDEADAFLWKLATGSLRWDRDAQRHPQPSRGPHAGWYGAFDGPAVHEGEWCPGWLDLPLAYYFDTIGFVTSSAGSNQSISPPADWNDNANSVEAIGGGGSGGAVRGASNHATGGGGGAYIKQTNFAWSSSITVRVAAGGTGIDQTTTGNTAGNDGGQSWWNDTAFPTTGSNKLGADKGLGGKAASGNQPGGAGGLIANNYPASTGFAGGNGGAQTGASGAGGAGGGGAGGKFGAGTQGVDSSNTSNNATAGGDGDHDTSTHGSVGTAGVISGNSVQPTAVTEWTATVGGATACAGGGSGGGSQSANASRLTGAGGLYGGGSGGCVNSSTQASSQAHSGLGGQGILIYTYTPTWKFFRPAPGPQIQAIFAR